MDTDIALLEKEFESASPRSVGLVPRIARLLLVAICLQSAYSAYRHGTYMIDVAFAIVLTWMAVEFNESQKLSQLHEKASRIIAFYKGKTAK